MAKGVLERLKVAARLKQLKEAAEQAAGELLEQRYRDTATQTLRGAAAVTTLMHDEMRDIDRANKSAESKAKGKPKRKPAVDKAHAKGASPKPAGAKKSAKPVSSKPASKKPASKKPASKLAIRKAQGTRTAQPRRAPAD